MLNELEVHSKFTNMHQPCVLPACPGATDLHTVSGKDDWQTAVFYWYTADCPTPAAGQPPDSCALVEVDMKDALIKPLPADFQGLIDGSTFEVMSHEIDFSYGKAVVALINFVLLQTTGYATIGDALQGAVDCVGFEQTIIDLAKGLVDDTTIFGFSLSGLVDSMQGKIAPFCVSQLQNAGNLIVTYLNGLTVSTPFIIDGRAGIAQDPGNDSNYADHLVNGTWEGEFNGKHKDGLASWWADR